MTSVADMSRESHKKSKEQRKIDPLTLLYGANCIINTFLVFNSFYFKNYVLSSLWTVNFILNLYLLWMVLKPSNISSTKDIGTK